MSCASSYNWVEPPIATMSIGTVFTECEFPARELAEQIRISETVACTFVIMSSMFHGMHGCKLLLFLQIVLLLT